MLSINKISSEQERKSSLLCIMGKVHLTVRYQQFGKKLLVSNKVLEAKSLPPTSAAAKYHTMRVYCQGLEWKGENVNPLEWTGRTMKEGLYL